jgi:penicillin-binding protein 2
VEKASSRLRILALVIAMMLVALSARLWYLQVLATSNYASAARLNSVRFVYTEPLRGLIYDDTGKQIVDNQLSLEVTVNRQAVGDQGEVVMQRLSDLLDVPVAQLVKQLQSPKYLPIQPVPVAEFVDEAVAYRIAETPEQFPGVEVRKVSVRSYPFERLAAHVLGYTGLITGDEYNQLKTKGYGLNDIVGRAGLEQTYESFLRGHKGKQKFIVNSDGDVIRALGAIPPTSGDDLHLTLDLRIQKAAETALRSGIARARLLHDSSGRSLRANAGVVIVMDTHTGGIRAMASVPSYDPSWYIRGLTRSQRAYLGNPDLAPSLNRAIQLGYTPGSTFKAITALTAVKEGIASLAGSYLCSTEYTHPGDTSGAVFTNWKVSNVYMSIHEALRQSCDTVFYKFGSDFYYRWVNDQLSPNSQLLQNDLRQWGFGRPTSVDLPAEAGGLVPDVAWAEANPQLFPDGFVPGIDILTMIGSSYVTATPLQMAQAYAAIANGGHLCRPHVVDRITDADGKVVKKIAGKCNRTIPYTQSQLQYIRSSLASVVSSGTAACPFAGFPLSQVNVAGKTGTAERGSPDFQDTSWFGAMVGPNADPDYVVITMVEQGGFGSQVAAPITRDVIERIEGLTDSPKPGCFAAGDR